MRKTPATLSAGVILGGRGKTTAGVDSLCVPLTVEFVVAGGMEVAEVFASCTEVDG